jgi:hypothetical protein
MLASMGIEYALDTQDYSGARVVLEPSVWEHHIQLKHPEVAGALPEAKQTIRDPTFVYEDRTILGTRLYYRLGAISRFRYLYLTVVIRFDLHPARVLTMYVTKEPSGSSGRLVYASARRHD